MLDLRRRMLLLAALGTAAWPMCVGFDTAKADAPPAGRRIALSGYDPVSYFTEGKPAHIGHAAVQIGRAHV